MLRPMLTELASIRSSVPSRPWKESNWSAKSMDFLKIQPEVFFRCILFVRLFLSMGQSFGRSLNKPQALGAASDCGWHVAAAAASIGTGNETDAGHPRGFPGGDAWNSAIWSSRYVEVYNTNAMDERWKRSVNLETRDFAACYSGSLYEYIDIDHGAD